MQKCKTSHPFSTEMIVMFNASVAEAKKFVDVERGGHKAAR
jgi:hypothetical protein